MSIAVDSNGYGYLTSFLQITVLENFKLKRYVFETKVKVLDVLVKANKHGELHYLVNVHSR